jgi:hypothetical protein
MRTPRSRSSLLVAVCSVALLVPSATGGAAIPRSPCSGTAPALTGKAVAHPSQCIHSPSGTVGPRGHRGQRGAKGSKGLIGSRGLPGIQGETGADGSAGRQGTQGATGSQGATGFTGPIGPVGPQGNDGIDGTNGTDGTDGTDGAAGPTGPRGFTGADGAAGPTGPQGFTGNDGADGPAGPTGPGGSTGPTGASGVQAPAEYAYFYNQGAQTVPVEIDAVFSSNGITTPGFTHAPGTAPILVNTAGVYKVSFSVTSVQVSQFGVFLNSAPVPNSVYGTGAATEQNSGQAIIAIAAGDTLTLRNHSSTAAVTLQTLAGGSQSNVDASLLIEKLN